MDFFRIRTRNTKKGYEIYPDFINKKSKDLMIRGKSFYAIWDKDKGLWSTDSYDVPRLVDEELDAFKEKAKNDERFDGVITVKYLSMNSSGMLKEFNEYVKRLDDNFVPLDRRVSFPSTKVKRSDYISKKLPYDLEDIPIPAYEEIISTLYDPEERQKIEWAIGSIVAGESKDIQKFLVLYGKSGTGKSTILNIIDKMFDIPGDKGYTAVFDAKSLGASGNNFATSMFKDNPLIAIQHDGDLSKIEDNSKLNSITSHEKIVINEKNVKLYSMQISAMLFMGTNQPVKITDAKSGIIRRLIDVNPSGRLIPVSKYRKLVKDVKFEYSGIAKHCLDVYQKLGPEFYNDYSPMEMIYKTDVFFNFMDENYYTFKDQDGVSLKQAWEMYKQYCDEGQIPYRLPMYKFREELKEYFENFYDTKFINGKQYRKYYSGFNTKKFQIEKNTEKERLIEVDVKKPEIKSWIEFKDIPSLLDVELKDCPAQYSTNMKKWENVKTTLSEIDTSRIHYVKVPENYIVIDFDIKDETGDKSLERNIKAASEWPETYAELSKSGSGIHLHYIYKGDVSKLSAVYSDNVEVKVFKGDASLRRKLTKCNDIPIKEISSGLPLKGDKKMLDDKAVKDEKHLRALINKALRKEIEPYKTVTCVSFIKKILDDAYDSKMSYDVTDLRPAVMVFASKSTNNAQACLKQVSEMHFKAEEISENKEFKGSERIIFYDVEVFSNLFVVCWKFQGKEEKVYKMINPSPQEIENLTKYRLVGFNCRRYDNHILYGRMLGYSNEQLYEISQRIINGSKNAFFGNAYNLSYTDVYDFAAEKMSLKKWEIELDIHHQELGIPWDQPVDEKLWELVADYCCNDVIATEAVFDHLEGDFLARKILADIAGMTVNDTTNSLTMRIIFGNDKNPQSQFRYRNLAEPVKELPDDVREFLENAGVKMPFDDKSLLPYYPGYKFEGGKSTYKGEVASEGGYVYAEVGMHGNAYLLDVESMHPSSAIAECLFGPKYTQRFKDIRDIRILIKHGKLKEAAKLFDGKLVKYLEDEKTAKRLSKALKIAINSVYGLTSAHFDNPFRDPRNVDNIVAKRGALFMIDLKEKVQKCGYQVAHIKTDSIKVPDGTEFIKDIVMDFGAKYGYKFEHEATYDKMCLVNDAVYIAKVKEGEGAGKWTATGAQFAHPYIFKTLFTHEPIEFKDMCETKSVKSALYLDMNEGLDDDTMFVRNRDKIIRDLAKELDDKNITKKLIQLVDEHFRDKGVESDEKHRHDFIDDILKELDILTSDSIKSKLIDIYELGIKIAECHSYKFIGRTGSFCPILPGHRGGWLVRSDDRIKYASATGAKGYRWLEAEMLMNAGSVDDIDKSYFQNLVDEAKNDISQYTDFEWFVSDDPYVSERIDITSDDLPF